MNGVSRGEAFGLCAPPFEAHVHDLVLGNHALRAGDLALEAEKRLDDALLIGR